MGIPIPTHKIGKLFDSLSRGEPNSAEGSEEPKHLGLGLYVADEIVTAHGGTISVVSTEKDGTTFTARFPRSAPLIAAT